MNASLLALWALAAPLAHAGDVPGQGPAAASVVAEADAAWEWIAQSATPAPPRPVKQRRGWLVVRDGYLHRARKGERRLLDWAGDAAPGFVRDLAADPAGLAFVAAENGLYITSSEVDVMDRVTLLDGAPKGSPNSVHVDQQRRVWLATDRAFGCIDPSFYYGRTIPVPGPPPYAIVSTDAGGIEVCTANGVWRYQPDTQPAPRVDGLELEGRALADGETLNLDFGQALPLRASGRADGGPVYRYRVDLHHVWRTLNEGVDADLEPGSHRLDVIAIDRDLRLSEPRTVHVNVAYPLYYQKSFVLVAATGVAALVFALFWLLGSERRGLPRVLRAATSATLVLTLGLQTLAGAVPHARGWPFIGYSMYTSSLDVGHIVYNGVLVGESERGQLRTLPTSDLGVSADNRWQVLGPLIRGGSEVNANAIEVLNQGGREDPIVRLQVWAKRWLVTEQGDLPISQMILSDYPGPGRVE